MLLNNLKVTDYRYIDNVQHAAGYKKGFIAQDVEKVFPEAVSKSRDFIPSIFSVPTRIAGRGNVITLTMSRPHGLVTGDTVRLISQTGMTERSVTVLDKHTFSFNDNIEKYANLFVFGKLVNDFRTLDYDRVFTLNVSATQQLSKEVDILKAENMQLKNQLLSDHALLKKMAVKLGLVVK